MVKLKNITEEYEGESKTKKFFKKAAIAAGIGLGAYGLSKSGVFDTEKAKKILKSKEKESADALFKRASKLKARTEKEAEKQKKYDVVDRQMKLKELGAEEAKHQKKLADEKAAKEAAKKEAAKKAAAEKERKANEITGKMIKQTGGLQKWELKKEPKKKGIFRTSADYWKKGIKDMLGDD